ITTTIKEYVIIKLNLNITQRGRSGSLTNERATKKQQLDTPDFSTPVNDNKTKTDIPKETEMEVNPVPSTSNDKGKQPEVPIPPVKNYGEDESFDTTENLLGTNSNTNIINFACEDDSPLFFAYCANEKFYPEHTNKEKINLTNEIFNGPHLPSFIGASVRPHPDNKQMKIIRISFSTRADFDYAIIMQITHLGNETFNH
ncbi:5138_t:CDS:2, partial [Funneliformis geosporum]